MSNLDSAPKKSLRALFAGYTSVELPDVEITDLSLDSRRVIAGGAFCALPGRRTHGLAHAAQAIASGAKVVLWEPAAGISAPQFPSHVIAAAVPDLTTLLGLAADRFFDEPSRTVSVAAITGTNGKTTSAYVLASALTRLGRQAAYAGTLGFGAIGAIKSGTHTTPDAVTVHRQLAELRASGCQHLGMEVSSHALDQHRVAGVRFHSALFTNLSHDHLDYHGTLDAYATAKARLFDWPGLRHAVINVDDSFGRTLAFERHHDALVTAVSSKAQPDVSGPRMQALFAERVAASSSGFEIHVNGSWGAGQLSTQFIGAFNVDNLLGVLAVLLGYDIPLDRAVEALAQCTPPPGRMETFRAPGMPLAIVDYAHTPDALEKALLTIREHCSGKVTCVFGCGGDRDATKRPLMGAIAERLADRVIVTDDNPRTEDGDAIVADILNGMKAAERVSIERDRAVAIERAIREAGPNDAVLIAGKGHEDYQIVGLVSRYFSDRDVVAALMRRLA
ncbi:MAG TPA: UDP-N-acetylmuramoyl-L-alanyl-D-glutamate--2,6-diaminopimelate ligase [Steroidobacteraceae bacterium]